MKVLIISLLILTVGIITFTSIKYKSPQQMSKPSNDLPQLTTKSNNESLINKDPYKIYFKNKPDEFILVKEEPKNDKNPEYPIWTQFESSSPDFYKGNKIKETYIYEEPGYFSIKLPKTLTLQNDCTKIIESPIKVSFSKETKSITIYSEYNFSPECELYKYSPADSQSNNSIEPIVYWNFIIYEFKNKNELEKIIQDNFGKKCKIKNLVLSENKDYKIIKIDEGYKNLSDVIEKGTRSEESCNFGWISGGYQRVNLSETKALWEPFNKTYASFIDVDYESKQNIYYDIEIGKSIKIY